MIYLLRHGDAEPASGEDEARDLTGEGERQARAAGRALAALGVPINACLSSPKLRAMRTAQLACAPLGVEPVSEEALRGGEFDAEALSAPHGDVLLVGHEPDFSNAIRAMTGARVRLAKGGIAICEPGTLHALATADQLEAIAGG